MGILLKILFPQYSFLSVLVERLSSICPEEKGVYALSCIYSFVLPIVPRTSVSPNWPGARTFELWLVRKRPRVSTVDIVYARSRILSLNGRL
jgi:hypothetical protein